MCIIKMVIVLNIFDGKMILMGYNSDLKYKIFGYEIILIFKFFK